MKLKMRKLVSALHKTEVVAIGNGCRRTRDRGVRAQPRKLKGVTVVMVNESGASVYSASDAAREEFPTEDITVRRRHLGRAPLDGPTRRAGENRR